MEVQLALDILDHSHAVTEREGTVNDYTVSAEPFTCCEANLLLDGIEYAKPASIMVLTVSSVGSRFATTGRMC